MITDCLQLATLYLPTKVTIYRLSLLLFLSSSLFLSRVSPNPSSGVLCQVLLFLSFLLLVSSYLRLSRASSFIPGQSGEKEKEREIEEAANRGRRLYSTPSSSVEDEGEGTQKEEEPEPREREKKGDVSVFLSSHLRNDLDLWPTSRLFSTCIHVVPLFLTINFLFPEKPCSLTRISFSSHNTDTSFVLYIYRL